MGSEVSKKKSESNSTMSPGQPQAPPNRLSHRLCCLGKSIYSFPANEMFGRGDGVEPSDPDEAGKHIAKVPFLIRARSVVQVHQAHHSNAVILTLPLPGISAEKPICQLPGDPPLPITRYLVWYHFPMHPRAPSRRITSLPAPSAGQTNHFANHRTLFIYVYSWL